MTTVTVHEAKTNLSRLLVEVENGAEVIVARSHDPVARLVPITGASDVRHLGRLRGTATIGDEHLAADEISALFGGA